MALSIFQSVFDMGGSCSRAAIDVIPDRDMMIEVVDAVVRFEDLLKRGQELTKTEKKEFKRIERVAKEMKKVKTVRRPLENF